MYFWNARFSDLQGVAEAILRYQTKERTNGENLEMNNWIMNNWIHRHMLMVQKAVNGTSVTVSVF